MKIKVKTTGYRELDRMFKKLPLKVKEKELRKGHRAAARLLVKAERAGFQQVAVNRTGATERGIGTKNVKERGNVGAIAVGPIRRRTRHNSAWKAHWFEWGTVKMKARPFIEPAWERTKQKMEDIVGEKLKKSLTRTMRKHRKL